MAFGAIAEAVGGLAAGVGQSILNYQQAQRQEYWNRENFDYQKALQQQIFEREDNAVQRRMADLKAAGLNPNLAAGSAANAGSVVGRASTSVKDINVGNPVGTMLDTMQAGQQLKIQKLQSEILNKEKEKAKYEAWQAKSDYSANSLANVADELNLLRMLGIDSNTLSVRKQGDAWSIFNDWRGLEDGEYWLSQDTPLSQLFDYQVKNAKNSAEMLQKDNDWYTADKIANYAGTVGSLFNYAGSGYRNFRYRR